MQRQWQPKAEVRAQIVSVADGGEEQVVLGRFNDRAEAQRGRVEVVDDAQQRYTRTTDHKRNGQAVGILQKDCRAHAAEERRRDLVKQVKKYGEEAKVAVRNIRRDAMDKFKAQKKKSEITEDDLKIIEKDLQKLTDDYIKEVERIADEKEKELMEI